MTENDPNSAPADDTETRKLSAVMFTDIRAFSQKMAQNEAGAFELLKKHDALLRVLTTKYGGKVIKSIGDSFMVDFPSAVNAVKCSIEAQRKFHHYNEGKSEFDRIEIRIGIHLGDVLIRGDDIFGDGVNIASRIESITEPTRICISQEVYTQVRNKLPVQVFRIGALTLKNIPEPVEAYEILIEDVPEFAQPSERARKQAGNQELDTSGRREAEEAREARKVEAAKQRAQEQGPLTDDQRRKLIEEHYTKAEKFYQLGHIAEAEQELKRIEDLDAHFAPTDAKRKQEEEAETRAQQHLRKARELIAQGKLEDAEAETNKVFEDFPLHVGAQQVLLRIEEERYRAEEEARSKKAEAEKSQQAQSRQAQEQQQVEEIMGRARAQLLAGAYQEAVFTLRELYMIDPNNTAARQFEDEIHAAQAEHRYDFQSVPEVSEEQRAREERLAALQRKAAEERAVRSLPPPEPRKPFPWKEVLRAGAAIGIAAVLYFGIPPIWKTLFPTKASIAAMPFTVQDGDSRNAIAMALPSLLIEDLARLPHVTVRSTGTSFRAERSGGDAAAAERLGVEYFLLGTVEPQANGFDVTIRLTNPHLQEPVFTRKFSAEASSIGQLRQQIVSTIIETVGLDAETPQPTQPAAEPGAYLDYLEARALIGDDATESLSRARSLLQTLADSGWAFPLSQALLAEVIARQAIFGEASDDELASAIALAENAARDASTSAQVQRSLGVTELAARRYDKALAPVERSLELQPAQAECYRIMAELWLIAGDKDESGRALREAEILDPAHPRTLFLKALTTHLAGDDVGAAAMYEAAIAAGGNREYITSHFLASAWLRGTKRESVVDWFQTKVLKNPLDYRFEYLLGRAFAEKLDSAQLHFEKGLERTKVVLDARPKDATAMVYRGLFLTRLGKFADGQSAIERALDGGVTAEILYRAANAYSLQQKKSDALAVLKRALTARFDMSEILNPDLVSLFDDPEFRTLIVRPVRSAPR